MFKALRWIITALAELRLQIFPIFRIFKQHTKAIEAFTLAEVLITLTIIGVIAALTIPTLIQNFQEAQYNTQVKHVYSVLSQAVNLLQSQNGGTVNIGTDGTQQGSNAFRNDFCNVMSCVKADTIAGIYSPIKSPFYYSVYKGGLKTNWDFSSMTSRAGAVLNDGTYISFYSYANCTNFGVNACGYVYLDANGAQKGPNMFGDDMYAFWIVQKSGAYSVLPFGSPGDGHTCAVGSADDCCWQRLVHPDSMP